MKWRVEYLKEALRDLKRLDPYNQKLILKAISKTAERPLPPPDGIGKPLGNHASSKLSGFYKIKLKNLGYRVVYQLVIQGEVMRIIVISVRDDDEVYKEAERRIRKMEE
ncbi:type II toxin-antitoxin system RelE/ParE family toxin [Oscillospiraceae bacterium 42-9]|uniref:type II toxin-antitoxin system RelE family toxin n=1 Tax=Acutalibacter sp. 1XD8-36 TaxID=2320852 RepID=UPI001412A93A|nr:type II toxin-antitoxin system RelE/ParE family toxin [Acutalibacter sp. 1XD8-36]NBJ90127.1 type II toxin-antitoxin system RelE/ParE family toxin [Acutalibacter sp. 1XD8-36]